MADKPPAAAAADKPPAAAAGVDNTARRTWDLDEYRGRAAAREEQHAQAAAVGTKAGAEAAANAAADLRRQRRLERDPLHQGLIAHRADLKARDRELDLEARLGKQQMVVAGAAPSQQAGYYCSVCDCTLRDSQSYLDHINGKYHNRALGMSMRAERSTAEQVRQRLREASEAAKAGKRPRTGDVGGGGAAAGAAAASSLPRAPRGPGGALLLTSGRGGDAPVPLRDGLAKEVAEEDGGGGDDDDEDEDDDDDGVGAALLPPGSEAYVPDGFDRRVLEAQEREDRERAERKRAKAEKKRRERAAEEEGEEREGGGGLDDPELAAMMGFGGFGGGGGGRGAKR